jgi:hypothetical protein
MAGQATWGNVGDTNNSYIVVPKRQKEIYVKSTFNSIISRLNGNKKMDTQIMRFGGKESKINIGNSSVCWETEITSGNEERLTMIEHRTGMPSGYGDYPVQTGSYDKYKHAAVYVNQIDSEAVPLPGRCSIKQVKDILNDPKGDALTGMQLWAGQEVDFEFLRAMIMGASRNLLSTTQGGLGITLPGASAGQFRSCYNTYVCTNGMVTKNFTRATYEAAVATALDTLTDTAVDYFDYGQHNLLKDLTGSLFFKAPDVGNQAYDTVVLSDPWLLARLAASAGDYHVLMRDAAGRGMDNPAINHMSPIILDRVCYIPVEQLKAFRASTASSLPVYGAGNTYDPRGYVTTNTSKLCAQIWLGAGAVLRATDRKMWVSAKQVDAHKDNYEYAMHWDDGFVRREYFTKDGRSELDNDSSMVAWFYDAGPEVAPAA